MNKFKKIVSKDEILNRAQDNVGRALTPITRSPIINGLLVSKALLAASTTMVETGLDRNIQGWSIVDQDANSVIWRDTSVKTQSGLLALKCTANTTVTLWIF